MYSLTKKIERQTVSIPSSSSDDDVSIPGPGPVVQIPKYVKA